ncbi:MAG: ubiquinol-cytochrome c reductase cytochrome b subunit [Frankiaceae bacterium]
MAVSATVSKQALREVDDRLGGAGWLRKTMNKVFPDHWSFMLGEIALYSFIILLLTGVFLSLFFDASVQKVIYQGSYVPLRGVEMTQAYNSTMHITFDIRGGLLMRQIHHWAALLFLSSIVVHLCRVFFTGAFRKPRETNWLIGVTLLVLGILEGFAGYSLPDDLLSGTGLRIAFSIVEGIPLVGTWAGFLLFGSDFPGTAFIPRLYIVHILLIPGVLLAMITFHLLMIWRQKHTDFPGPGKTEDTVVGSRLWPTYALKGGGFFFIVFGMTALLGGLAQINPVWLFGPYNPSHVSAGSQPDWYMGFLDGAMRLIPNWETNVLGHTISWNILLPSLVLPGIIFTLMAMYPFLEAMVTGDHRHHNLLDRPRNRPSRTALGMMSLTFYFILLLGSSTDVLAVIFHSSFNVLIWAFRVLLFAGPPLAYYVTRRICLALQRSDAEVAHHGVETGIISRSPTGEYTERHAPVPTPKVPELVAVGGGESGAASREIATSRRRGGRRGGRGRPPGGDGTGNGGGVVTKASRALGGFFFDREEPSQPDPESPSTLSRR